LISDTDQRTLHVIYNCQIFNGNISEEWLFIRSGRAIKTVYPMQKATPIYSRLRFVRYGRSTGGSVD